MSADVPRSAPSIAISGAMYNGVPTPNPDKVREVL